MNVTKINISNISFRRAIRPDEEKDYGQTIADGKKYAGIKNLALILHGSSFPQADKDLFVGSPFNEKAAEVNDFLKMHGFDSIQLGPPGLIKMAEAKEHPDYSPYISSVNSKNYLFADMQKLTTDKYSNILKSSDIDSETSREYEASTSTDFERAIGVYNRLFEKAYDNLSTKTDQNSIGIKVEFEEFKQKSSNWLENDSLFEVLKKGHQTSDIDQWPDLSKNLISYKENPENENHQDAMGFIEQLHAKNGKEIELYKFKQFIMDKQEKEFNQEHPGKLKYISDAIIGFSIRDYWANQDAFLPDYRVGCPYGGEGYQDPHHPRGANQMWGIPVIAPKALFNDDGSLGKGGKLLRQKFEKLLDTYQNIRVDHALGLVDPWIYNRKNVDVRINEQGRVAYADAHGRNLAYWENVEKKDDYKLVLEKILLPVVKEKGLKPNDLVWEDLGCPTRAFNEIYYGKLKLPGLFSLKNAQAENKPQESWFLLSSHDDPPFTQVATDNFYNEKAYNGGPMNPNYLIGYLHPEKSNKDREPLINNMCWDTRLRVITKNQELMRAAEKIQVSFMDFFGLDKTYNKAGTRDPENWKLRLSKDYKKDYYKTLESKDWRRNALNMPELLKRAVISKVYTSNKSRAEQDKDFEKVRPLVKKLDYYEKVLYEPEKEKKHV